MSHFDQSLADQLPDPIARLDATGLCLGASAGLAAMWGVDTLHGRSLAELIHPDDRARHLKLLAGAALATTNYRVANGVDEPFWVEERARAIEGGRLSSWRRLADRPGLGGSERSLEENEARYRGIVTALEEGIVLQLADLTTDTFNPAAERLMGFSALATVGRNVERPEEWRNPWQAILEDGTPLPPERYPGRIALATGEPQRGFVMGILRPTDGQRIWLSVNSQPLFLPGQSAPYAVVSTLLDVTERKRSDRMKDEFLGVISHELRTPTNAITGFASILADGLAGPLTPPQQAYVEKVLNGSELLLALIDDLLDMSRMAAGKFSLAKAPMDLASVAEAALTTLVPLAERKGHRLAFSSAAGLPLVAGDPQRLGQVVMNLVGNAIKFTPAGGFITVELKAADAIVECRVRDSGPGVPEEHYERIFERFVQLDGSVTRTVGGTGLGLSIVKALVEAHGGEVGVESEPGRGSTFWFRLAPA